MIPLKRVLTALIGIAIMVPVSIFSHTLVWPLVMTMLSVIATFEILRAVGIHKKAVFAVPFYGFSLLPTATWIFFDHRSDLYRIIVAAIFLLFLCEFLSILLTKNSVPGEKIYSAIALVSYVVLAFTALTMSRRFDNGEYLFLLIFIGAWVSDTFAFLTGKYVPDIRNRLVPFGGITDFKQNREIIIIVAGNGISDFRFDGNAAFPVIITVDEHGKILGIRILVLIILFDRGSSGS